MQAGMADPAYRLPQFIVVKPYHRSEYYNAYYKKNEDEGSDGGSLAIGSATVFSIFSRLVKIEVERATTVGNNNYVNLRFCYSNRYWQKAIGGGGGGGSGGVSIAALSKEAIEDTSDESCTLFEPFLVGDCPNIFCLRHVSSGTYPVIDGTAVYLRNNNPTDAGSDIDFLRYVDWETLVQLPDSVAFKGDNGKYIGYSYIPGDGNGTTLYTESPQFNGTEANERDSVYRVIQLPDGHVQIATDSFRNYWIETDDWVRYDGSSYGLHDDAHLFWPVKIDGTTIALRSKSTGRFLQHDRKTDFLCSRAPAMTADTRLRVEEPTLDRKIHYVNYMMEDARILNELPYLAGSTVIINATDIPATHSVTITYQDEKSYTFGRGVYVAAGVTTEIKAGLPFLEEEGKIAASNLEVTGSFQWDTTTTTTTSATATGSVEVPARSSVVVEYVGTKGSCEIPYTYSQIDRSATDGEIIRKEMADGTYTGVSCYNFSFQMRARKSIVSDV